MKRRKRVKPTAKKKEKKKINYKPVLAFIIFILAVAALYTLFVSLGIELGRAVKESAYVGSGGF